MQEGLHWELIQPREGKEAVAGKLSFPPQKEYPSSCVPFAFPYLKMRLCILFHLNHHRKTVRDRRIYKSHEKNLKNEPKRIEKI